VHGGVYLQAGFVQGLHQHFDALLHAVFRQPARLRDAALAGERERGFRRAEAVDQAG